MYIIHTKHIIIYALWIKRCACTHTYVAIVYYMYTCAHVHALGLDLSAAAVALVIADVLPDGETDGRGEESRALIAPSLAIT
jgi:hypothetical protein